MLNSKSLTIKGQPGLYRVKIVTKDSAIKSNVKQIKVGSVSTDTTPPKNIFRVRAVVNKQDSYNVRQQVYTIQGEANTTYWFRLRTVAKDDTKSDWYYATPVTTPALGDQQTTSKPKINTFLTDLLQAMLYIQGEETAFALDSSLKDEIEQLLADCISNVQFANQRVESIDAVIDELLSLLPDLEQSFLDAISSDVTEKLLVSSSLFVNRDFYNPGTVDGAVGELIAWLKDSLATYLADVIAAYTYGSDQPAVYLSSSDGLRFLADRLAGIIVEIGLTSKVVPEFADLVFFLASAGLLEKADVRLAESISLKETLANFLDETITAGADDIFLTSVRPVLYDIILPLLVSVVFATDINAAVDERVSLLSDRTSVEATVGNDSYLTDDYLLDHFSEWRNGLVASRLTSTVSYWFLDRVALAWLLNFADYIKANLNDTCATQPSLIWDTLEAIAASVGEDMAWSAGYGLAEETSSWPVTESINWIGLNYGGDVLRLGFNEVGIEGTLNPTPIPRRDAFVLGQAVLGETILGN
ncbi:hypothetical protein MTAT_20440 [Moorella thermoacetica]|uniref:Uncharacterized protein n=1 Tax=Neomoorella thermoacetica TaxID=1525 RepID=A0AAC9HIY0_NEOTH|nr:hypothetical protein [Moorella thermoacetica]AOQ24699.1 hypothetical protein Maut_02271 [Moorella thermoacetica]TYL12802.1 hypothetical protein MTAT_20440 [Moorella thermoacetica]